MSNSIRKCVQCGALPKNVAGQYCEYCGTELPKLPQSAGQSATPEQSLQVRFQLLQQHAMLSELMRHTPSVTGMGMGMAGVVVFGGIFTAAALFMATMTGAVFGPVALFPLLFVAVGIGIMFKGVTGAARLTRSPLQRELVTIVDERTDVSGGGSRHSRASTTYFATVQDATGRRTEYTVAAPVAGKIAPGDMGVVYLKADYMIDFQRVPV